MYITYIVTHVHATACSMTVWGTVCAHKHILQTAVHFERSKVVLPTGAERHSCAQTATPPPLERQLKPTNPAQLPPACHVMQSKHVRPGMLQFQVQGPQHTRQPTTLVALCGPARTMCMCTCTLSFTPGSHRTAPRSGSSAAARPPPPPPRLRARPARARARSGARSALSLIHI